MYNNIEYGIYKLYPLQQKAILPIINKKDLAVKGASGTGKSLAMIIGLLQIVDPKSPEVQAIVLTPVR